MSLPGEVTLAPWKFTINKQRPQQEGTASEKPTDFSIHVPGTFRPKEGRSQKKRTFTKQCSDLESDGF